MRVMKWCMTYYQ